MLENKSYIHDDAIVHTHWSDHLKLSTNTSLQTLPLVHMLAEHTSTFSVPSCIFCLQVITHALKYHHGIHAFFLVPHVPALPIFSDSLMNF